MLKFTRPASKLIQSDKDIKANLSITDDSSKHLIS